MNNKTRVKMADEYAQMVGKRFENLTVIFIQNDGKTALCRCDCGKYLHLLARSVRDGRYKRCITCQKRFSNERGTLCWRCANACNKNKCSWANGVPRSDWQADKTRLWSQTNEDGYIDSFLVIKCPGFVPDGRSA